MTIPESFTFFNESQNVVSLMPTDSTGVQLPNTSNVTVTLYWGRDRINPNVTPGIVVQNANAVQLSYNSISNTFSGVISSDFDAPPGGDYVLVVSAVDNLGSAIGHWERRAVVVVSGP